MFEISWMKSKAHKNYTTKTPRRPQFNSFLCVVVGGCFFPRAEECQRHYFFVLSRTDFHPLILLGNNTKDKLSMIPMPSLTRRPMTFIAFFHLPFSLIWKMLPYIIGFCLIWPNTSSPLPALVFNKGSKGFSKLLNVDIKKDKEWNWSQIEPSKWIRCKQNKYPGLMVKRAHVRKSAKNISPGSVLLSKKTCAFWKGSLRYCCS